MVRDLAFVRHGGGGTYGLDDTFTCVCPFCSHCHVDKQRDSIDTRSQETCHECNAVLGSNYQCPQCAFPRGWKRVNCPVCGNRQPVFMPHWWIRCDCFKLECVHCEHVFHSLCIC